MPHGFLAAPQQGRTAQSLQSFRNAFRIIRNVAVSSRLEGGVRSGLAKKHSYSPRVLMEPHAHLPLGKRCCSIAAPLPGFRPVVKIAGGFAADDQAVHKLVGKIIDSNPPRVSIDLGRPSINRIVSRSPGEFSSELVAQLGRSVSQSSLFAPVFDFPNRRSVACPSADMLPSVRIRLARSSPFQP